MIPPHPDPLSPEDRALIDEAVAAGRVRRFPMGLTALPLFRPGQGGGKAIKADLLASIRNRQRQTRFAHAARLRAETGGGGGDPCMI